MALPKKKNGFRSIIINEQTFNWRITDNYLDIRSGVFPETKIHIALEWIDHSIPFEERSYLNNLQVTPRLVSEAIAFALDNQWNPAIKTTHTFLLSYAGKSFSRIIY
ncbi:MAG: hypothetical protein ACO1N0_19035 [Fluviicola sp.]